MRFRRPRYSEAWAQAVMMRVYGRWERAHPTATTLERIGATYRVGNAFLRHTRRWR